MTNYRIVCRPNVEKDGRNDAISKLIAGLRQYITSSDDRWISNPDQPFRWPVILAVDKKNGPIIEKRANYRSKTSALSLTISDEFVSSRCNTRCQRQSQEGCIYHKQILFVPLWNCQPTKWTLCEVWCLDKCVTVWENHAEVAGRNSLQTLRKRQYASLSRSWDFTVKFQLTYLCVSSRSSFLICNV